MSFTDKSPFAPGCFGSALAFSAKDDLCQDCPFFSECSAKSALALEELQAYFEIPTGPAKRKSDTMSVKAQEIFEGLGKTADEIRRALMGGTNPFSMRKGFMGDVCFVLLNQPQVTRAFLTEMLQARREIKPSVADMYVRQSIQILRHCEAVAVDGDVFSLRQG